MPMLTRRSTSRSRGTLERKLISPSALERIVRQAQGRGQRVVFTNGCFDLLHPGHVELLERAKQQGDLLIVAINSDRSVRRLKGPHRPIVCQQDRAFVLAGLRSVDYVTIFGEPTPQRLIARLRPQVLVKGADWSAGRIVGRQLVEGWGGRVVRIPLRRGHSTSQIVHQVLRSRARTTHG